MKGVISSAVRYKSSNQGNRANQGSDNDRGAGAPLSQEGEIQLRITNYEWAGWRNNQQMMINMLTHEKHWNTDDADVADEHG